MPRTGSTPIEEIKTRVAKKLRVTSKTAAQLGSEIGMSGRGVGRALGELVREGRAIKLPTRVPTYRKPPKD
jgi:hypothetical protein